MYVDGDGKRTRKPMVIKRTTPESNVVAGVFMAESNDEVMEEILESRIAFVGCMFDTTHYGIMVENRSFKSSIMKAIFFDVPRPVLVKKWVVIIKGSFLLAINLQKLAFCSKN